MGLLVAFLAVAVLGGNGLTAESGATGSQLGVQAPGVVVAVAWAAVLTLIIVKVTSRLTGGLRIDEEDELVGIDLATHGERGYDLQGSRCNVGMKLRMAGIQPHKLYPVHKVLVDIGVTDVTVTEAKAFRKGSSIRRSTAGQGTGLPMAKIETVVKDGLVEQMVSGIRQASTPSPEQSGSTRCCPRSQGKTILGKPSM